MAAGGRAGGGLLAVAGAGGRGTGGVVAYAASNIFIAMAAYSASSVSCTFFAASAKTAHSASSFSCSFFAFSTSSSVCTFLVLASISRTWLLRASSSSCIRLNSACSSYWRVFSIARIAASRCSSSVASLSMRQRPASAASLSAAAARTKSPSTTAAVFSRLLSGLASISGSQHLLTSQPSSMSSALRPQIQSATSRTLRSCWTHWSVFFTGTLSERSTRSSHLALQKIPSRHSGTKRM
mmetsp:Transcript_50803/g.147467  ORF Transcript_50803/g.147467 Transcript_50803/m.147467 type:complete len:239 (-) Transcript_50803:47-763(-)